MKKIYTLVGTLLLSATLAFAQAPANRTTNTIIADVLAQLPADKPAKYNQLMKELVSAKEAGVLQLVGMMKDPSKGQNAKYEYALASLTFHAAKADEVDRLAISNAYIKALDTVAKDRETKAFVIRQLEFLAQDEAIDVLTSYLSNESLVGPAARTLAAIGSDKAGIALANGLAKATTSKDKQHFVNALGFMKAKGVENTLRGMLDNNDPKLQQVVIYSLTRVGTKESLKDMSALAKKANYAFEHTAATTGYIKLIQNILAEGNAKEAEKAAKGLIKDAEKARAGQARQAAMQIVIAANPTNATKMALEVLKDPCSQYRMATLRAAGEVNRDAELYSAIVKALPKASGNAKRDVAGWMEEEAKCSTKKEALKVAVKPLITELITGDLAQVKAVSLALVKIADKDAIIPLARMLTSDNKDHIIIAKEALLRFPGDVSPAVVAELKASKDDGKVAILDILANRKASKYLGDVISLTNTGSDVVKEAAYRTLKNVVEAKDIESMYSLLESADIKYVPSIQEAVIEALAYMPAKSRFKAISSKIGKTPDNKKYLYYTALASTEDSKALDMIVDGFKSSNKSVKDGAFEALAGWKHLNGAEYLYDICKDVNAISYFERALESYIRLASNPKMTGENRVIYLREAMVVAKTPKQKIAILNHIQKTASFQGLMFAGQYMNDNNKDVAGAAGLAVSVIAMGNKDFTGETVKNLLLQSKQAMNHPDAHYQVSAIDKHLREVSMDKGYVSIFNGKDLAGWKGLVGKPHTRAKMKPAQIAREQVKADKVMREGWFVENGELVFTGKGDNICTTKPYGDFEMYVDWKLDPAGPEADAGIYLRGLPQVQIWDTSRVNVGAQVGSGGLYNNKKNDKPLKVADNKLGTWNSFYIKMVGDRVTVLLNGELVVDNIILENLWERNQPIPFLEQIELQAHGSKVYYRDIYIKELDRSEPFVLSDEEKNDGFEVLFDGTNMHNWTGNTVDYILEDGCIAIYPKSRGGFGGNLYTKKEYSNFVYRFEFQMTAGANNGVGIRTPMEVDAAYHGMEIQVLDYENPIYKNITKYQVHGSVYGIIPAKREGMKPVGEWNYEEIVADGDNIKVTLNGVVILDGNIREATKNGTPDGKKHPGLFNKSGHIGFLGHGSEVKFKNIRVKELK